MLRYMFYNHRLLLTLIFAVVLSACANRAPGGYKLVKLNSENHNSRVKIIVLHYTVSNTARSLNILTTGEVSSHYLVTNDPSPKVYRLVDENRRAWHAGVGSWYKYYDINSVSVGIEIVNKGPTNGDWEPYGDEQINAVAELVKDIARRHNIDPKNIVGHSDIAPQRKQDPGPAFPWQQLAKQGIGRWYNEDAVRQAELRFLESDNLPDAEWIQSQLRRLGYATPSSGVLDKETVNVLRAFQMHYRPELHDGTPDARTMAILEVLP